MLEFYVDDLLECLSMKQEQQGWEVPHFMSSESPGFKLLYQSIEATLQCIKSIQEAVPLENSLYLSKVFGPEILGKLPTTGQDCVRRTMLCLIGNSHFLLMQLPIFACAFLLQPPMAHGSRRRLPRRHRPHLPSSLTPYHTSLLPFQSLHFASRPPTLSVICAMRIEHPWLLTSALLLTYMQA